MQAQSQALGLNQLTIIERIIGLFHLPYIIGCAILAAIMGPAGILMADYMDTGSTSFALNDILSPYNGQPSWIGILDLAVVSFITFWLLYMIRFMRQRLAKASPQLVSLSSQVETTRKIFGRVSKSWPQLLVTATLFGAVQIFLVIVTGASSSNITSGYFGPGTPLSYLIELLFYLTIGTFIWVYASSLWGIHRFGRQPLKLKPFYQDPLLGLGEMGTLSLYLAFAYYTVFGPIMFESLFLSPDPIGYATLFPFAILGAMMFFLPLNSIHQKMIKGKKRETENIDQKLSDILTILHNPTHSPDGAAATSSQVENLLKVEMLQVTQRSLDQVPNWPYDKATFERFTALVISVASVVISQLAQKYIRGP